VNSNPPPITNSKGDNNSHGQYRWVFCASYQRYP
jgi:hypothetical protein